MDREFELSIVKNFCYVTDCARCPLVDITKDYCGANHGKEKSRAMIESFFKTLPMNSILECQKRIENEGNEKRIISYNFNK